MRLLCENGEHLENERVQAIATIHLTSGVEVDSYAVCAEHLHTYVRDVYIQQNLGPRLPFSIWPLECDQLAPEPDEDFTSITGWLRRWS